MRKLVVGLAITVGAGAYLADHTLHSGKVPSFILSPVDALPAEISPNGETLFCATDTQCDPAHAIGSLAAFSHTDVDLGDTGAYTPNAIIAAEDRRFYQHNGIDIPGIGRAILADVSVRSFIQGASTIDRQTAGIIYPKATPDDLRKSGIITNLTNSVSPSVAQQMYEGRLALKMNQVMTKNEILQKYLNSVYFGRGAYGIEAAAKAYFGIDAKVLDLQQSIVLASLVRNPACADLVIDNCIVAKDGTRLTSDEQLTKEQNLLLEGYDLVITKMVQSGYITKEQATELHAKPIGLVPYKPMAENKSPLGESIHAQHFVDYVKQQAMSILNIPADQLNKGYKIYTTLSSGDQQVLVHAIDSSPYVTGNLNAAGVNIKQDGAVSALVGSKDYYVLQQDIAIGRVGGGSGRDGGSINKGFAYAYALAHGWQLTDVKHVDAKQLIIPGADNGKDWKLSVDEKGCDRLGRTLPCDMTVAEAMAVSSNDVAAMIVQQFGIKPIAENMKKLGVDIQQPYVPSMIIGTGNVSMLGVATGYNSLLLNNGQYVEPYFIMKIVDPTGKVVYEHTATAPVPVYDASISKLVANGLQGVFKYGTAGGASKLPTSVFVGKTGTADNNTDVSFAGSAVDDATGGDTIAITILDPRGKIKINATSHQAAEIAAGAMQAFPGRSRTGSLIG